MIRFRDSSRKSQSTFSIAIPTLSKKIDNRISLYSLSSQINLPLLYFKRKFDRCKNIFSLSLSHSHSKCKKKKFHIRGVDTNFLHKILKILAENFIRYFFSRFQISNIGEEVKKDKRIKVTKKKRGNFF